MPRSIDEGFRDFISRLTPSDYESLAAQSHRKSIEQCLKNNFECQGIFRTGSFGNGTSISGYSDVDYFAIIPSTSLKQDSNVTLRLMKEAFQTRFWQTQGIVVRCPAVQVPFGQYVSESTEIVPAEHIKYSKAGHRIFEIPDCNGGWRYASPDAHNDYVRTVDKKYSGKVKALIRILKAWKFYRSVPISSFYLEMRTAQYCYTQDSILYIWDLRNVLKKLLDINLGSLQDPCEISGYISPCGTQAKLDDALSKLENAFSRADKALEAYRADDISSSFSWLDLLFDYKFPSYYY